MVNKIQTTLSISPATLELAQTLAQEQHQTVNEWLATLLEKAIAEQLTPQSLTEPSNQDQASPINQGDLYWIQAENPQPEGLGYYPHPYVIIQDNLLNHSRIHSVVVCALTTNLKQASAPGNVLLAPAEGHLPKRSVVVVSKVSAVPKTQLGPFIGALSAARVGQILAGMRFLQSSYFRGQT